jgi:hypothetical protein
MHSARQGLQAPLVLRCMSAIYLERLIEQDAFMRASASRGRPRTMASLVSCSSALSFLPAVPSLPKYRPAFLRRLPSDREPFRFIDLKGEHRAHRLCWSTPQILTSTSQSPPFPPEPGKWFACKDQLRSPTWSLLESGRIALPRPGGLVPLETTWSID